MPKLTLTYRGRPAHFECEIPWLLSTTRRKALVLIEGEQPVARIVALDELMIEVAK